MYKNAHGTFGHGKNGHLQVHSFFYIRIQFIRILRLRFAKNIIRKQGNICSLQKQSMSNESTHHQEKQFKHISRGRDK